jgi:hypothetical protein
MQGRVGKDFGGKTALAGSSAPRYSSAPLLLLYSSAGSGRVAQQLRQRGTVQVDEPARYARQALERLW